MKHLFLLIFTATALMRAQQGPPPVKSPEVSSDGHVTFRLRSPNAKEVWLNLEGAPSHLAMHKDDQGVWSAVTDALAPDLYGYTFTVDGTNIMDPANHLMKPNLLANSSEVHVEGASPQLWDQTDVPHGAVHEHFYQSRVVGDERHFYVYTPPGYDPAGSTQYPVLYLLHGYSDDASGWSQVGKANLILDNLITQGKTKPMVVVMPLGYGAPEILKPSSGTFNNTELRERNFSRFREALLTEVLPAVEKSYRVSTDREMRAIAGLSMGGAESLLTGLNTLDKFSWIGAFSAGGLGADLPAGFPRLDAKANERIHLLWIACGTEDRLIEPNRKLITWLKEKDVHLTAVETPGMHTWMVWRRNLAAFTPLLFRVQ